MVSQVPFSYGALTVPTLSRLKEPGDDQCVRGHTDGVGVPSRVFQELGSHLKVEWNGLWAMHIVVAHA